MCFVSIYENRTRKPVEIVLRRGWGTGRTMEGVNLTKIHCKHICKYHNVYPVQLLYANKIKRIQEKEGPLAPNSAWG
jgi:hypothetical protein